MRIPLMKQLSWYLIVAMFIIGITPKVEAGIVPSEVVAMSQTDRTADIEKIQKVLEMKMVKERLEQLGFTQDEIQTKLGSLSDQQMHNLALQMDDIKAGGDGAGALLFILIVIILVLVIVRLLTPRTVVVKEKA